MDSHFGLLDFTSFTLLYGTYEVKSVVLFFCCAELMIKLH